MDDLHYEITVEALRVLFLLGLPLVLAMALIGTIGAALQTATAIHDSALTYAIRLITLVVLIYLLLPTAVQSLLNLTKMAFS